MIYHKIVGRFAITISAHIVCILIVPLVIYKKCILTE